VFFSSHVLSDAEALCSRVAILAKGRLVSAGRLTDILAFETHGWDLIAADVDAAAREALAGRARHVVEIGAGRYQIELPADVALDQLLAELARAGARPVSVNPIRATLEDFFVEQVARQPDAEGRRL
jgi:ABC-2 type transport system ATP-binding protein